jgi:hypothetical protein
MGRCILQAGKYGNSKTRYSCTEVFNTMEISPFYSQCIFSLLLNLVNNIHLFTKNIKVHNRDTRSADNFHLPIANLTKCQNGPYYAGINIFNHLPTHTKCLAREEQDFISAIKWFLVSN